MSSPAEPHLVLNTHVPPTSSTETGGGANVSSHSSGTSNQAPVSPGAHKVSQPSFTNAPVQLNIGGHRYTTTLVTLRRQSQSSLAVLMDTEKVKELIGAGKEVFIDRDGPSFRYILCFLRDGPEKCVLPRDRQSLKQIRYVPRLDTIRMGAKR